MFVLFVSVPTAVALYLGGSYFNQGKQFDATIDLLEQAQYQLLASFQVAQDFINYDQRNVDFFAVGESFQLLRFAERFEQSRRHLQRAQQSAQQLAPQIKSVLTLLDDYERALSQVLAALKQRGFKDHGLIGEMRRAIHRLDEALDNPSLRADMLALRGYEKNYIIRNQQGYVVRLNEAADRLANAIRDHQHFTPQQSSQLSGYLLDYQRTFNRLVEIDRRLGVRSAAGMYENFRAIEIQLVEQIGDVQRQLHERSQTYYREMNARLMAAILITVFAAIVISVVLARSLSKPLNQLSAAIREFVRGDFAQPVSLTMENGASSEVRRLSQDFSALQDRLMYFVSKLRKQKSEVDRVNARLFENKAELARAQRMARMGYIVWDVGVDQVMITEELTALFGGRFRGVVDGLVRFSEFVCSDDRQRFIEDFQRCAMAGQYLEAEYQMQIGGEESIWVRVIIDSARDAGTVMIATLQDISSQRVAEAQIRQLAFFDSLTGLASRSYLYNQIERTIDTAARDCEEFSLMFIDLDDFKEVNDSLGHAAGDQMLETIGQRLQGVMRSTDFAARLGGDEFCVLLHRTSQVGDVVQMTERLVRAITAPLTVQDHHLQPAVSIGIAQYPKDGRNVQVLMQSADSAMYEAKHSANQTYAFFDAAMSDEAANRLQKAQALRQALIDEEFVLFYQPQVSLHSGQIVSFEALARWQHPELGLITPDQFIDDLEKLRLIDRLGDLVIEEACRQLAAWRAQGLGELMVAVNVSPSHLENPGLVTTVQQALLRHQIQPHCLLLEVTESGFQSSAAGLAVITALKALGVHLAIDDFGVGYSSFGSLRDLPLDCLKIDRSFVHDMLESAQDELFLKTIVGLAQALNMKLVAEGVENTAQIETLKRLGCDVVQGYYFSAPVPAEQVPGMLELLQWPVAQVS